MDLTWAIVSHLEYMCGVVMCTTCVEHVHYAGMPHMCSYTCNTYVPVLYVKHV